MADAKATLTQRLDAVIQHLRQQQSNAPISLWVITELETIKTAVVDYEPPPLMAQMHAKQQAINRAWDETIGTDSGDMT